MLASELSLADAVSSEAVGDSESPSEVVSSAGGEESDVLLEPCPVLLPDGTNMSMLVNSTQMGRLRNGIRKQRMRVCFATTTKSSFPSSAVAKMAMQRRSNGKAARIFKPSDGLHCSSGRTQSTCVE